MARFSKKGQGRGTHDPRPANTRNAAGGVAWDTDARTKLATVLLSSFACGDHYRNANEQLQQIQDLAVEIDDWEWCAKSAIFARDHMGMRTSSHFLAAICARHEFGGKRDFLNSIVVRPDDMCEIIGAYWALAGNKAPLPAALKRGFADRFQRFDEYQVAKYAGGSRDVSLTDVMRLCHFGGPLAAKLSKDELAPPATWEVGLSAAGSDPAARARVWAELLSEKKLGYMALLRNLRNIAQDAPDQLRAACAQLVDNDRRRRARVFPFRLFTAYNQFDPIQGGSHWGRQATGINLPARDKNLILDSLEKACDDSLEVIPEFDGPTLVVVDTSGSMSSLISQRSTMSCMAVGFFIGACLAKKLPESDIAHFADDAEMIDLGRRSAGVTTLVQRLFQVSGRVGHGTNFSSIFGLSAIREGKYRRIIVLSDMQSWYGNESVGSQWASRQKAFVYSFNLHSDGTSMFDTKNPRFMQLSGFSDKIWEFIPQHEEGPGGMIQAIDEICLKRPTRTPEAQADLDQGDAEV